MKSGSAYLLAVFIWLAALPTCHSTGNPTAPADGSGGGGAGGTDGAAPDRFSGTDGAVPDRSSGSDGGTADRSGVPDAIDGAVAMTPTEICRAAVKAQAERVSVCEGYPLDERLRVANLCPDYFFNADSNRTVANVAACLGTLAAQTCTDIVLNFVPSCLSPGKRSAGAGCAYSSQCGSGMCGGTGEECSTCRAGGIPVGSPCRGGDCESGSFCHGGTRTCIEASTIVYAAGPGQVIRPPPVRTGELDVVFVVSAPVVLVLLLVAVLLVIVCEVAVVAEAVVCRTLGPSA